MIETLAERQRLVTEVAALKHDPHLPLRDAAREGELLSRISTHAKAEGVDGYFAESLYRRILEHSVRFQASRQGDAGAGLLRVSYQGIEASYSHAAARSYFAASPHDIQLQGYPSFAAALDALARGDADRAFLPIENSVVGSITDTYDLLRRADLHLVGEEVFRVEHCLLALEPVPLGLIRRIGSHPQALGQCSTFLESLGDCHIEMETDTASAAMLVAEAGDLSRGAIASEEAASRYGLHVVKRNVANQKENYTRFVVVARQPERADPRLPHKTSLLVTIAHETGALTHGLEALARHGVNLTKLESRPSPERPWQYLFFLDHEGGVHEEHVSKAHAELATHAEAVRVLGSYPLSRPGLERAAVHGAPSISPEPPEPRAPETPPLAITSPKSETYRLASRSSRPHDTVIEVAGVRIGGNEAFSLIAGPCSVESREQIMECARAVQEAGGRLLRGGCFKPRTSPYDFQGGGFDALTLLHEAARAYGLGVVTEVTHPGDVDAVIREADVLQIGARNMQNFALLKAVAKTQLPVLLKRGMMASIDEWLAAAEYVMAGGNMRVILCERGIRTFETATRNTLDLSSVPVLRERTHLPVMVDPSHAAGRREWVAPLTRASRAVGAHGAMIEFHPNPEDALSDGRQSLTVRDFGALAREMLD